MSEPYTFFVKQDFVAQAILHIANNTQNDAGGRYRGVTIATDRNVEIASFKGEGVWLLGGDAGRVIRTCGVISSSRFKIQFQSDGNGFTFRSFLSDNGQDFRLTR